MRRSEIPSPSRFPGATSPAASRATCATRTGSRSSSCSIRREGRGTTRDGASLSERLADVALAGGAPPTAAARAVFDFCGGVGGAGRAAAWPADHAGRLAAAAHARDQDDLHLASVTHPGGIVWSAVAACGLETDATWGEAAAAAALGYELVVRLAEAAGPEHRSWWHATTTAGVAGAAGAAGLLLGDRALVAPALGHALSVTSGSAQAQRE